MSLITAIPMLGIIIMTHEFGHFLLTKLDGIGVIESSLGMGSRLFSFEKGGTQYSLKILPFGSPYMILGEDEGTTSESALNNKFVWARTSVVAAGSVFSFILALGLSMVLIGITGYDIIRLAGVVDEYPAQAAGMKAGNAIKSINGRKVHSYRDINWYLFTHLQKFLTVTRERMEEGEETERFSTELAPVLSTENSQYMMGVQFSPVSNMAGSIGQLPVHSAYEVQYWIHYVFGTFYMVFYGMVSINDISGSVGIVNAINTTVDEAASYSMSAMVLMLINFTILLSADLSVMNLLPIPALDGRHLMSLVIEAVRGEPIDKEKEGVAHMTGMAVLLALMVPILFSDVQKLF